MLLPIIRQIVEKPYIWPDYLMIEHNYFHVPEIGSKIRYRSVVSSAMRRAERRLKQQSVSTFLDDSRVVRQPLNKQSLVSEDNRKRLWLSPSEQSGDDHDNKYDMKCDRKSPWLFQKKRPHMDPEYFSPLLPKSEGVQIDEEDEDQGDNEIIPDNRRSSSDRQSPQQTCKHRIRGSRELASLFTPVLKSQLRRPMNSVADETGEPPLDSPLQTTTTRFKQRTPEEEDYVSPAVILAFCSSRFSTVG